MFPPEILRGILAVPSSDVVSILLLRGFWMLPLRAKASAEPSSPNEVFDAPSWQAFFPASLFQLRCRPTHTFFGAVARNFRFDRTSRARTLPSYHHEKTSRFSIATDYEASLSTDHCAKQHFRCSQKPISELSKARANLG